MHSKEQLLIGRLITYGMTESQIIFSWCANLSPAMHHHLIITTDYNIMNNRWYDWDTNLEGLPHWWANPAKIISLTVMRTNTQDSTTLKMSNVSGLITQRWNKSQKAEMQRTHMEETLHFKHERITKLKSECTKQPSQQPTASDWYIITSQMMTCATLLHRNLSIRQPGNKNSTDETALHIFHNQDHS